MNLIVFALRRPITVMVLVISLALGACLALRRMDIDIFPKLNLPVIYVCQPYGGMDPAQMEGLLTNYYEYHFLYISGIHHVESKNVQSLALMKLVFHPGTDMSQAMAETIAYVNRSRAFMPPGTVPPFVMRFDTGSVPVGYLVLSSETKTLAEIQDQALFKVRPMFASLPGVSAPPPFGGSQRSVVVRVDPDRLRAYRISPEDVVNALVAGNTVSPSGNVHVDDTYPIVPINSIAQPIAELGNIPLHVGARPALYLRDLATIEDSSDIPTGYALFNGRRAIYILVTKRADASTRSVVGEVKRALPKMQEALPEDIHVSFELDQSPYVTRAIQGLVMEGALGACLTGLMVLLFLRDWRTALVVVLNIPLALMGSVLALWLADQTINLMTLSGLALAIGILVDEATVEVENIHSQMASSPTIAHAVRRGNAQTALPRLLAMLCILAVFITSFFMEGATRGLFVPLSLAVGFSMLTSYLLSSTFVPVVSVWLLRHQLGAHPDGSQHSPSLFARALNRYRTLLSALLLRRKLIVAGYFAFCGILVLGLGTRLGIEVFPKVDAGQFRLRLRAADGTHFSQTEKLALQALDLVNEKVGPENVDLTLGYVGTVPTSYPINAVYQWSRGPEEAILRVALREHSGISIEALQETLRQELARRMPEIRSSFEPGDIISEVMSFGSTTPVEISVSGPNVAESRAFIERLQVELATIPSLRDLQISQSLNYPTLAVRVDREKAGLSGVTTAEVARSLVAATGSSRFVVPNYWPDPKTGVGYQVQVEIPQAVMRGSDDLGSIPVKQIGVHQQLLLRDIALVKSGSMFGQFDRYNMKREISLTANISGADLGSVAREIEQAVRRAGELPKGANLELRGLIPPMRQMLGGLGVGLTLAVVVIFLLLAANFQSWRLAMVTVSTAPAVMAGVVTALWLTGTTLNLQSFIGAIMAVGVAMANAILLVSFAEEHRREEGKADIAAVEAATSRLRPILMTSFAMTAGMIPMALAWGESGEQAAALGRAVIGGLVAATVATLWALPAVFAVVQARATSSSASLDPDDPRSRFFRSRAPGNAT